MQSIGGLQVTNEGVGPRATRLRPFVFLDLAIVRLLWFLALPAVRTLHISLLRRNGSPSGTDGGGGLRGGHSNAGGVRRHFDSSNRLSRLAARVR